MKLRFSKVLLPVFMLAACFAAQAASLSDYWENKLDDMLFRGQTYTLPSMYIGLSTDNASGVNDTGCANEVSTSGTNYSRAQLSLTLTDWLGTDGATTASAGTNGTITNNSTVTVGTSPVSADWGTVRWACVFDQPTGGNLLWYFQLSSPQTVSTNANAPTFPAGSLTFQIDN